MDLELLRCPATGGRLITTSSGGLASEDGERRYRVLAGVPVLITAENDVFFPASVEPVTPRWPRVWRLLDMLPTGSRNVAATERFRRVADAIAAGRRQPARVLVVGGGTLGLGMESVVADPRLELIETDVYIGPRTDLVCDAHQLPFVDGAFDGVICQAVLEHVADPVRAVAEIHRVLCPDGVAYSEVPFIQQVHGGAHDFTRFTHLGHRRLYRRFDELESGAQGGPGMALSWSFQYFLRALAGESRFLRVAASRGGAMLTFWLTWLDPMLVRRPAGIDAASGTYFLGRRRDQPVSDAEVLAGYRGPNPTRAHS